MATIREYFDTDARAMTLHHDWSMRSADGADLMTITAKIAYDLEGNAKYWYFYIPANKNLSACLATLANSPEVATCWFTADGDGIQVEVGFAGYSEKQSVSTLQFTKRIHLYLDFDLTRENRASLVKDFLDRGYYLSIRDREYARLRSEHEKPLAFISHDSRDKDELVRALAHELMIKQLCPVWYDEFSLNVGDSLRANIEKGLKECRKCIVVLSPHFLSNGGWTKAEFDSVFTREMLDKENVILPVWHNVGVREVYEYSPRLADKVGLPSTLGVEELSRRLSNAVKKG